MVQQDPYASLNPGMTVDRRTGRAADPPLPHVATCGVRTRVLSCSPMWGSPRRRRSRQVPPRALGGQRQRVAIARSLTVDPRVLVADEALSMLDVSIRVSVLRKLRGLCQERQLAVLFITHDLAVARQFGRGHSIAVMQRGRIVEHRPTGELVSDPQHPYTQALLKRPGTRSSDPHPRHPLPASRRKSSRTNLAVHGGGPASLPKKE